MNDLHLRTRDLSWRLLDGEVVALDSGESLYLGANRSGALLWTRLAEGTTRNALVTELASTFGIDPGAAEADVDGFLAQLRERGLLEG